MRAAAGGLLPFPLSPVARENLTNRVYGQLRAALMEGRLWPGQRLKIRDLARGLAVSETPVREAVMQLVREGGLEMSERGPISVARLTLAQYLELRRIRLELEGLAAEAATPLLGDGEIALLEEIHASLVEAEATGDWSTAVSANWRFHFSLYRAARMPELQAILERIWLRNGPLINYHYPDAAPTYAGEHQHLHVIEALKARDALGVRRAVQDDMIEGGRRLVALLREIEAGTRTVETDAERPLAVG